MKRKIESVETTLKKHRVTLAALLALVSIVISVLILMLSRLQTVQNLVIAFGGKIKGSPLNALVWQERFSSLGLRNCLVVFFVMAFFYGLILFCLYRTECERSEKLQNGVCAITALFSAVFVMLILDGGNNWGGDFSEYIAQARAIVTGTIDEQVRNNSYIISNTPIMLGDAVYPWGFPLLMSPFYALFGKNLFFLKFPVMLSFAVSVIFCNLLFRRHFSFFQAEVATLFIAVNPQLVFFCNAPLSDMSFLCFSTITVYYCEKLFYTPDAKKQIAYGALTGIFSFLAFMTRSNGIVFPCLFVALHILMLLSYNAKVTSVLDKFGFTQFSKPNIIAHVLPYVLFVFLLAIQNSVLPRAGTTHSRYLSMISARSILSNCSYYITVFRDFFPFGKTYFHAWLLPFCVAGFIRNLFRKPVLSVYVLGVMGILILWPGTQGIRFCFPAIPMLIIARENRQL